MRKCDLDRKGEGFSGVLLFVCLEVGGFVGSGGLVVWLSSLLICGFYFLVGKKFTAQYFSKKFYFFFWKCLEIQHAYLLM